MVVGVERLDHVRSLAARLVPDSHVHVSMALHHWGLLVPCHVLWGEGRGERVTGWEGSGVGGGERGGREKGTLISFSWKELGIQQLRATIPARLLL